MSPRAFAAGAKDQEAGEISLQGTAIEVPEEGTPSMPELKVLYYNQMIRFHKHSNNYIEIVRCLIAMYEDKKGDSAAGLPLLKQIVWCALEPSASARKYRLNPCSNTADEVLYWCFVIISLRCGIMRRLEERPPQYCASSCP